MVDSRRTEYIVGPGQADSARPRAGIDDLSRLKYLLRCYRWGLQIAVRAAPRRALAWGLVLAISGVLPPLLLECTRRTVQALATGQLQAAWPLGGMLALILLAQLIAGGGLRYTRSRLAEQVQENVQDRLHQQASRVGMDFFDHAESYDQLHRSRFEALNQPMLLLDHSGSLLQSLFVLTAVAVMLSRYVWWIPIAVIVSGLPSLWFVARRALAAHRMNRQQTLRRRQVNHYNGLLTERESAAELRIFGLADHFREQRAKLRRELDADQERLDRSEMIGIWSAGLIGWTGTVACLGWVLMQMARAKAGVADVVMIYQAFVMGQRLLTGTLESAGSLYRASMFLSDLDEFLRRPPEQQPVIPEPFPVPIRSGIRFERVSFTYPGASSPALQDFSLGLPAGRITAIVGLNGAGKSTLIRLLCGFYHPDSGRILIDDVDLANIRPAELRTRISVLFQEAMRYSVSARDNIACGDLDNPHADVEAAARAAAADGVIAKLLRGYDTRLGKTLGGAELSGGEWQRLALARALLRDSPLLLLDEPTSAMDSWTEAHWFTRLRERVQGRTVLLITHRFTSARQADYIHVMEGGTLLESGDHGELLQRDGSYARAWHKQVAAR